MASSENMVASNETWAFRTAFDNNSWFSSEAFSRDTEILTRALQHSISNNNNNTTTNNASNDHVRVAVDVHSNANVNNNSNNNNALLQNIITSSSPSQQQTTTQTHSVSSSGGGNGSEAETVSKKRATLRNVVAGPKIAKRKSRATKRSPTTFITADPENFRQMVQQVTGVRFMPGSNQVVKPEPYRPAGVVNRLQTGCFMPTLDTSAFLLDHHNQQQGLGLGGPNGVDIGPPAVVAEASGSRSDFDAFTGFPTLESWN